MRDKEETVTYSPTEKHKVPFLQKELYKNSNFSCNSNQTTVEGVTGKNVTSHKITNAKWDKK